jgi:CheY-like chemotaxis protein
MLDTARTARILLAEDNLDDVELLRMSFERARLLVDLHHVNDGQECMDFLLRAPPYENAPTPDILLLDLNMPRLDGREVLSRIAAHPVLRSLPVIMLTTSYEAADIRMAYDLRCSSYITKPVDFNQFTDVVRKLTDYWFSVVVLPTELR